ncbi:MAG: FecR domain-containing protein [Parabacteroides sp.]|nr:FecR domain-containing protein [Parabacteroides sp.]
METPDTNMIEYILPRYCSGEATAEECRQVEEWIKQSDENYRIAKQIHTLYLATDTIQVLSEVDTEKALSSVCQKLSKGSARPKVTVVTWLQRVAAILFIPLLIAFGIQNLKPRPAAIAQMIEVKTNPGMTTTVTLPDGSVVHLNSESKLSYPSFFDKDKRRVALQGEAFFEVRKDPEQGFVISTPHETKIEVLGTSFNVEAFEEDAFVSTTLIEGKVRFDYMKNGRGLAVQMKPGQKLTYDSSSSRVQLTETNGESEIAWKDGKIVFQATPLPEALRMLEKRFNVAFVLSNDRLRSEAFTGSFSHQRLDRILEIFKISSNIKWRYLDTQDTMNEKTRIEIY